MKNTAITKLQKKLAAMTKKIDAEKEKLAAMEAEAKELQDQIDQAKLSEIVSNMEKKGLTIADFEAWVNEAK